MNVLQHCNRSRNLFFSRPKNLVPFIYIYDMISIMSRHGTRNKIGRGELRKEKNNGITAEIESKAENQWLTD